MALNFQSPQSESQTAVPNLEVDSARVRKWAARIDLMASKSALATLKATEPVILIVVMVGTIPLPAVLR